MVRKKDQTSTPQSSSTGSSSSGSSSSSSGSSSSESSSSSDTEGSSAVSTRSRTRSRGASSEKDASQKSFPSLMKLTNPPSSKTSSSSSTGGMSKKGEKVQPDSFPQFPSFPVNKRASSESAPEPVCNSNKRGPKTSATSVPKSHTNAKTKSAVSSKSQASVTNSLKGNKKSVQNKKSTPKKAPIVKEALRDKKQRNLSLYTADNSSESERETRGRKLKITQKALLPSSKPTSKSHPLTPKLSFLSQKQSPESKSSRKGTKTPETSTNSSLSSSGSDSDSSESSQGGGEKNIAAKKDAASSGTEKEDDNGDRQQENSARRLVTRSSSVKTKRSSLLGINKACTDSDSENVVKPRRGNRPSEVKKCARPLINSNQYDVHETYMHEPSSKCRTNVKKPTQKVKNNMLEKVPFPPIESRNCPVDECNSTGHLGGLYERHFTVGACPVFRNITKEQTKNNRSVRLQENDERERAISIGTKSPRHSQKMEQRNYCNKIRDSRDRMSEVSPGDEDMADSDRQPSLRGLTPDWDLQLFLQAQADASEKNEDEMRGLPDTKGIRYIQMGHFEMEAWYLSQYPDDYNQQPKIFVCEFCLKYMRSRTILIRHADKCVWKHPPGDEIYRKEKLSVWEVDGTKYKTYCQNLCLLAMLFLDHKTLYYDVEPFLFYIMTIADAEGCHIVGYFSKEKNSFLNYNVSCIMTLPPYQRQGFGRLLIDFSYLLTREEDKIGSPEKPLSDLGLISYRSYWKDLLLKHLSKFDPKNVSIKDLSAELAVSPYDIVSTFQAMGMMKYWKGKHILLKRQDLFEDFQERTSRRWCANKEIDPTYLNWRPYVPPIPIEDPNVENKEKNNKGANERKRPTDVRSGSGESTASLPVKSKRPLIQHLTNGE